MLLQSNSHELGDSTVLRLPIHLYYKSLGLDNCSKQLRFDVLLQLIYNLEEHRSLSSIQRQTRKSKHQPTLSPQLLPRYLFSEAQPLPLLPYLASIHVPK